MSRTDIHRPSSEVFDPEAYECEGVFDLHPEDGNSHDRIEVVNMLLERGYRFASHQASGQCGHCGARLRYTALMTHDASMEMIYVGETCLDNRFESLTRDQFQALRKAAALSAERRAKAAKIAALLEDVSGLAEAVFVAKLAGVASQFVQDVIRKLYLYGDLSERQLAAVVPAAARDLASALEWVAREAELAADPMHVLLSDVARCAALGSFVMSVGEQYRERGRISDRQREAIQRVMDRQAQPSLPVQVLTPGIYESGTGEVFKVQKSRGSDRLYAKVLNKTVSEVRRLRADGVVVTGLRYEYEGGAVARVQADWRVSEERAVELGHLTGICIDCGTPLEDADSVAAGRGPICGGRRRR